MTILRHNERNELSVKRACHGFVRSTSVFSTGARGDSEIASLGGAVNGEGSRPAICDARCSGTRSRGGTLRISMSVN